MLDKEYWTERLMKPLYENRLIQTIRNTPSQIAKKRGWYLKSGLWSPWFLDLRFLGSYPKLFHWVCKALGQMIIEYGKADLVIGVEMAGVILAGGVPISMLLEENVSCRTGYTRTLPKKPRTLEQALKILETLNGEVTPYGQKRFVEADFKPGDRVVVLDDMATSLASKQIAQHLILWEAEQRGIPDITCQEAFYLLNRKRKSKELLEEAGIGINYIIEFDHAVPQLQKVMTPDEYRIILEFQEDMGKFQSDKAQKKVITALA